MRFIPDIPDSIFIGFYNDRLTDLPHFILLMQASTFYCWALYDERLQERDYYQRIFASRYEQPTGGKHNIWSNNVWQRVYSLINLLTAKLQFLATNQYIQE
ncbi:MAG: hypothetical protein V4501_00255 [Pseudomonadota bacterium]